MIYFLENGIRALSALESHTFNLGFIFIYLLCLPIPLKILA